MRCQAHEFTLPTDKEQLQKGVGFGIQLIVAPGEVGDNRVRLGCGSVARFGAGLPAYLCELTSGVRGVASNGLPRPLHFQI